MPPRGTIKASRKVSTSKNHSKASSESDPPQSLLFSGLHFYFFPNSRSNKARALRIDTAVKWGASTCHALGTEVTHIVVDDALEWSDFVKHHSHISELPRNIAVVNGRYVSDCISYGMVLSPVQKTYQVRGHEAHDLGVKLKRMASEPSFKTRARVAGHEEGPNLTRSMTDQPAKQQAQLIGRTASSFRAFKSANSRGDALPDPTDTRSLEQPIIDTREPAEGAEELSACFSQTNARSSSVDVSSPTVPPPVLSARKTKEAMSSLKTPGSLEANARVSPELDPMIMQRPLDGKWVKLRCKECGLSSFPAVREFMRHCFGEHRQRFKSKVEAIDECGVLMTAMNKDAKGHSTSKRPIADEIVANESQAHDIGASQQQQPPAKRVKRSWQDGFACMSTHNPTVGIENPNSGTIARLQEMATHYDGTDQWRNLSFRRGVTALKNAKVKIKTKEEALKLPNVGTSIAEAIEKIVQTGNLPRLDAATADPRNKIVALFTGIYGVGLSQANKWISQGFKTLDDIREKADLNENQKVGLAHYDELQLRIPREEVKEHARIVIETLAAIDDKCEVTIGGSYRRGSQDSGDIDLLLTKYDAPAHELRSIVFDQLIPTLTEHGFLKVKLASSSGSSSEGSKWHGCSCLPRAESSALLSASSAKHTQNPWRRIDFLLVPWEEMGAALIYFTGNDIFNRSIRLLAQKKGMRLNQRGLYRDVLWDRGVGKVSEGELVEGKCERRIFELLGVPWREPRDRCA